MTGPNQPWESTTAALNRREPSSNNVENPARTELISSAPFNDINLVIKLTSNIAVKFGIGVTAAEAEAQAYASRNLDPAVVKVPSVIQFFSRPVGELWTTGYLVMDLVEGTPLDDLPAVGSLKLVDRIKRVVQHVHSIGGGDRPSPLDSSHAQGLLWSEYGSIQRFDTRADLQRYLDLRLNYRKSKETIDVTNMPLSLCHLDIALRNIVIGSDGSIHLLDWGCAGFYPPIFETWAVRLEDHIQGTHSYTISG